MKKLYLFYILSILCSQNPTMHEQQINQLEIRENQLNLQLAQTTDALIFWQYSLMKILSRKPYISSELQLVINIKNILDDLYKDPIGNDIKIKFYNTEIKNALLGIYNSFLSFESCSDRFSLRDCAAFVDSINLIGLVLFTDMNNICTNILPIFYFKYSLIDKIISHIEEKIANSQTLSNNYSDELQNILNNNEEQKEKTISS